MRRFFLPFLLIVVYWPHSFSQSLSKPLTKQLSIVFENDVLALRGTDRYYTNGLMINFSKLATSKRATVIKSINTFEIGQRVYTPGRREVYVLRELDRPITGYLYGSVVFNRFLKGNKAYSYGGFIGTIGKNSGGKGLLDVFHPVLKINSDYWDWMFDYQLKNEVGVNLQGSYNFSLLKNKAFGLMQVTPVSHAVLGTSFINFNQSVVMQFGRFNNMNEGAFWGSRLHGNNDKPATELFGYYQPEVIVQGYNATVQGGMIRKDKGGLVDKSQPVQLNHNLGIMYASGRLSADVHFTFQGKDAKHQETRHEYAGLRFSYMFR